jgi:hypothetical protein
MLDTMPIPVYAPPAQPRSGRVRPIAATVAFLLAAVLTLPAGFALWGQRTLVDTQRYAATVGPLIRSSAVQQAITARVTDAIDKEIQVGQGALDKLLSGLWTDSGSREKVLGTVSGLVQGEVNDQVKQFISSPVFAALWAAANVEAQRDFLRVLRGDNSGILAVQGSQIVVKLSTLISQVEQRLAADGLTFAKNLPVPSTDTQIVLASAPHFSTLRTGYAFIAAVGGWLFGLVAALYASAIVIARRRARMAAIVGVALMANAVLAAVLVPALRDVVIGEFSSTAFAPITSMFYNALLGSVRHGAELVFLLGAGVAFLGWCAGSTRSATAVRRALRAGSAPATLRDRAPYSAAAGTSVPAQR